MKCTTRDFGEMQIEPKDVIHFIQPPFGFEEFKNYTLIYDNEIGAQIVWLQSIDEPSVCFILFDPSSLSSFYAPEIPQSTLDALGAGEILCWTMAVISNKVENSTINLKSPIVVNLQTGLGAQLILEQDYPVKYPLMKGAE